MNGSCHSGEGEMVKNSLCWAIFSVVLIGCAGDPIRVQLPPNHPADRRAHEPEFWTIPNPFAGSPEIPSTETPAGEPAGAKPEEGPSHHHHGHQSTGGGQPMPEGQKTAEGAGQPHQKGHGQ